MLTFLLRVIYNAPFSWAAIFLLLADFTVRSAVDVSPLAESRGWLWAWLLQDMSCLPKLTPKVWLFQHQRQRCKINIRRKTSGGAKADRMNKGRLVFTLIFSQQGKRGARDAAALPAALVVFCFFFLWRSAFSCAEWTRACTMPLSTPRCWKCRPWWLSSTMTSAGQEIPWRTPRRSATGHRVLLSPSSWIYPASTFLFVFFSRCATVDLLWLMLFTCQPLFTISGFDVSPQLWLWG